MSADTHTGCAEPRSQGARTSDTARINDRYDVVIAGARVAGASTALLLARAGLDVLVVDPVEAGRDTLSTHALMRGAVMQLWRWGVLDAIREAGTPAIDSTTFHYDRESIRIPLTRHGPAGALYAPRRTVLDRTLIDAARHAGATFAHGLALTGIRRDGLDRVAGVEVTDGAGHTRPVDTALVVGADGVRSRVARLVGARYTVTVPHATASIYGYWPDPRPDGYHWYYVDGLAAGMIPTNAGESCVFAGLSPSRFLRGRRRGLDSLFDEVVARVSPDLASRLSSSGARPRLRGFAGAPSFLREATGPGWALVGDAGYFKDPLTAHGITDALRDAELLARAVVRGSDAALLEYESTRDALSRPLLEITSRVASLRWSLEELRSLHLDLSREMRAEVEHMRQWDVDVRFAA